MKVIDVYEGYFAANGRFNGVERRGAKTALTAESDCGQIKYTAGVTFFPHRDETDFAVSYDACFEKVLFAGAGRRSKKRDSEFLKSFRAEIDSLAEANGAKVLWELPIAPERRG
jgi:hypothetical protein